MGKGISRSARKQIFNILFLLVLIGITLFILLTSNRELNFENIKKFILGCNPWLIAVAFVCMLLFIGFEGMSLHLISRRLGHWLILRQTPIIPRLRRRLRAVSPLPRITWSRTEWIRGRRRSRWCSISSHIRRPYSSSERSRLFSVRTCLRSLNFGLSFSWWRDLLPRPFCLRFLSRACAVTERY